MNIAETIKAAGITQEEIALRMGCHKSQISRIISGKRRVPAERVLDFERITGIPREELRPDLYRAAAEPRT